MGPFFFWGFGGPDGREDGLGEAPLMDSSGVELEFFGEDVYSASEEVFWILDVFHCFIGVADHGGGFIGGFGGDAFGVDG